MHRNVATRPALLIITATISFAFASTTAHASRDTFSSPYSSAGMCKSCRLFFGRTMLLRVVGDDFTAYLLIKRGFCTEAEPALDYCVGCSAPWLKGHFIYKGWRGTIVPDRQAPLAQTTLTV